MNRGYRMIRKQNLMLFVGNDNALSCLLKGLDIELQSLTVAFLRFKELPARIIF